MGVGSAEPIEPGRSVTENSAREVPSNESMASIRPSGDHLCCSKNVAGKGSMCATAKLADDRSISVDPSAPTILRATPVLSTTICGPAADGICQSPLPTTVPVEPEARSNDMTDVPAM